jgi:uncharacterized membrane-anchored protein YhcB (DUF1043 family)
MFCNTTPKYTDAQRWAYMSLTLVAGLAIGFLVRDNMMKF